MALYYVGLNIIIILNDSCLSCYFKWVVFVWCNPATSPEAVTEWEGWWEVAADDDTDCQETRHLSTGLFT